MLSGWKWSFHSGPRSKERYENSHLHFEVMKIFETTRTEIEKKVGRGRTRGKGGTVNENRSGKYSNCSKGNLSYT